MPALGLAWRNPSRVIDGVRSRKPGSHQIRRWRKTDSNPQSPLKKDPPRRDVRPFHHFPSERDRGFESVFLRRRVRFHQRPAAQPAHNPAPCRPSLTPPGRSHFWLARRKIRKGRHSYDADESSPEAGASLNLINMASVDYHHCCLATRTRFTQAAIAVPELLVSRFLNRPAEIGRSIPGRQRIAWRW